MAADPAKFAMQVLAEASLSPSELAERAAAGVLLESSNEFSRTVLDEFQLDELLSGDTDTEVKQRPCITPDRNLWFTSRRSTQSNVVSVICTIRSSVNEKWQNALSADESSKLNRGAPNISTVSKLRSPFESKRPRVKDLSASVQVQKDLRCEEAAFLNKLGIRREQRISVENQAAVILQRTVRGFLMRRWLKRNAGRLRLQRKMQRSYQVISKQIRLKLELAESAKRAEEHRERASIKIQSMSRMFLAQRATNKERCTQRVERLNESATKMCAFIRRALSYRCLESLRQRKQEERVLRATSLIQSYYRMWHLGKKRARSVQTRRQRQSCIRIQCAWRCIYSRKRVALLQNQQEKAVRFRAAILIQAIARGVACRMKLDEVQHEHEHLMQEAATLSIQRVCRGWLYGRARVRFIRARIAQRQQVWASINIQRIIRGKLARIHTASMLDEKLTDIFFQARLGRRQEVEDLHEFESCLDLEDLHGDSVLTIACRFGYRKMARKAIKWGLNIDHENDAGQTGVVLAIRGAHVEIAEMLLAKKCKVPTVGRTLLHDACQAGLETLILPLLLRDLDANQVAPTEPLQRAPLHLAIMGKNPSIELVKHLVEAGHANVEVVDSEGSTPLHLAAKRGLTTIVQYLIDEGNADVQKQDLQGRTPWKLAVLANEEECAELLSGGWQIDMENDVVTEEELRRILESPEKLVQVIRTRGDKAFLKTRAAVEAGFPVEYQAPEVGLSVLMAAASADAIDIVRLVANADLISSQHDAMGRNVFHHAANSEKVLELLLKKAKGDLEECLTQPDSSGTTALHALCASDCLTGNLLRSLQASKLNLLSVRDKLGNTILHSAAYTCAERTVSRILQMGISPSETNFHGDTALHSACTNITTDERSPDLLPHLGHECIVIANRDGQFPIHLAAKFGCSNMLQALLKADKESKTRILHKDKQNHHALFLATEGRHESCLSILLSRADASIALFRELLLLAVTKTFNQGFKLILDTALNFIEDTSEGDKEYTVRDLGIRECFEKSIKTNSVDIAGMILATYHEAFDVQRDLELAISSGHPKMLSILLQFAKGIVVDESEIDIPALARLACGESSPDSSETLSVLGALDSFELVRELSILATAEGKFNCLVALCEAEPSLVTESLSVDDKATTLLHIACSKGHVSCVEILLHRGASKDQRDEAGASPLELATDEVVAYFVANEE